MCHGWISDNLIESSQQNSKLVDRMNFALNYPYIENQNNSHDETLRAPIFGRSASNRKIPKEKSSRSDDVIGEEYCPDINCFTLQNQSDGKVVLDCKPKIVSNILMIHYIECTYWKKPTSPILIGANSFNNRRYQGRGYDLKIFLKPKVNDIYQHTNGEKRIRINNLAPNVLHWLIDNLRNRLSMNQSPVHLTLSFIHIAKMTRVDLGDLSTRSHVTRLSMWNPFILEEDSLIPIPSSEDSSNSLPQYFRLTIFCDHENKDPSFRRLWFPWHSWQVRFHHCHDMYDCRQWNSQYPICDRNNSDRFFKPAYFFMTKQSARHKKLQNFGTQILYASQCDREPSPWDPLDDLMLNHDRKCWQPNAFHNYENDFGIPLDSVTLDTYELSPPNESYSLKPVGAITNILNIRQLSISQTTTSSTISTTSFHTTSKRMTPRPSTTHLFSTNQRTTPRFRLTPGSYTTALKTPMTASKESKSIRIIGAITTEVHSTTRSTPSTTLFGTADRDEPNTFITWLSDNETIIVSEFGSNSIFQERSIIISIIAVCLILLSLITLLLILFLYTRFKSMRWRDERLKVRHVKPDYKNGSSNDTKGPTIPNLKIVQNSERSSSKQQLVTLLNRYPSENGENEMLESPYAASMGSNLKSMPRIGSVTFREPVIFYETQDTNPSSGNHILANAGPNRLGGVLPRLEKKWYQRTKRRPHTIVFENGEFSEDQLPERLRNSVAKIVHTNSTYYDYPDGQCSPSLDAS